MTYLKDSYKVTFNFKKELDKSIMVHKKTKKISKMFFIPKSIIMDREEYQVDRNLWKDVTYTLDRITLELPRWYCEKELGFYR